MYEKIVIFNMEDDLVHKSRNIIISVVIILIVVVGAYYVYNTKKHNSENDKSTQSTSMEVNKSQKQDKSTNTNKNTSSENNTNIDVPETKDTEKSADTAKHTAKETKDVKEDNKDNKTETDNKITQDKAVQLVEQSLKQKDSNTKVAFDHDTTRNNVEYYVIHSFDSMKDHIATSGWYYVDKSNGKVYEWDLATDKLNAIN